MDCILGANLAKQRTTTRQILASKLKKILRCSRKVPVKLKASSQNGDQVTIRPQMCHLTPGVSASVDKLALRIQIMPFVHPCEG